MKEEKEKRRDGGCDRSKETENEEDGEMQKQEEKKDDGRWPWP